MFKVRKYSKFDKDQTIIGNLLPLEISSFLVAVPEMKILGASGDDYELVKAVIKDKKDREAIISVLGSINALSDIITDAHKSGNMVYIGHTTASFDSFYKAVTKRKDISSTAGVVISFLITDYLRKYDMVLDTPAWAATLETEPEVTEDDITGLIVNQLTMKALAAIPKRSGSLKGRVPVSILAQDVVESFKTFQQELLIISSYEKDVVSVLSRIRAYVLRDYADKFGDQSQIFVQSETFKKLTQNYTLVKQALEKEYIASSPILWELEDARVTEVLRSLNQQDGIRQYSTNEIKKLLNLKRITSLGRSLADVIVYPKMPDVKEMRFYRGLKTSELTVFFKDTRLTNVASAFNSLSGMYDAALHALVGAVADKSKFNEELNLITYEPSFKYDKKIYEYLGAALSKTVYVDSSTRELVYSVDVSELHNDSDVFAFILTQGLTKDPLKVILTATQDIAATEYLNNTFYSVVESERRKYLNFTDSLAKEISLADVKVRMSLTNRVTKKKDLVELNTNIFKNMYGLSKGRYYVTGFSPVIHFMQFIEDSIKLIDEVAPKESDRLYNVARHWLTLGGFYDRLIYQALWNTQNKNVYSVDDMFTDLRIQLHAKQLGAELICATFDLPVLSRLSEVVSDRTTMFSDLGMSR